MKPSLSGLTHSLSFLVLEVKTEVLEVEIEALEVMVEILEVEVKPSCSAEVKSHYRRRYVTGRGWKSHFS